MTIPKNLQFLTHIADRLRYGQHLQPARDWFVILVILLVALIVSVVWNVTLFFGIVNGVDVGSTEIVNETPVVDPVTSVWEMFMVREGEELRYKSEYHFVDPSR